mmetsp:Transcript_24962/g.36668  ORF Transcript_24962/g.36668 Transcript_24962/m.36668 type:complete len:82 (+) Transcript_24962:2581-2826(+)
MCVLPFCSICLVLFCSECIMCHMYGWSVSHTHLNVCQRMRHVYGWSVSHTHSVTHTHIDFDSVCITCDHMMMYFIVSVCII